MHAYNVDLQADIMLLLETTSHILFNYYLAKKSFEPFCMGISRHTVVCRAAQEAGVPPVSILTGRKKMQFSHLCSSVIPYPIGTKFAREVPAS